NKEKKYRILRFTCISPDLNTELKFACWRKYTCGDWSITAGPPGYYIKLICEWLNHISPSETSLIQRELDDWLECLRLYLIDKGLWNNPLTPRIDSQQNVRYYQASSPALSVFRNIYRVIEELHDNRTALEKDVWDMRKMGARGLRSARVYTLNFEDIPQT